MEKKISFVSQKPHLINGSLEENIIHLSNNKSNNDLLNRIISMPWMKDITEILNYKKLSERTIYEAGSNLSGGQIQRIAIARALFQETSILILDEVTSALDKVNEEMLINTFEQEKMNKCIIMVTHRMKPLRICDDIIYLDDLS